MAISSVTLADTFDIQRLRLNQVILIANEVKEGAYSTSGNITITGAGTGLNVSANVWVGGSLTIQGGLVVDTGTLRIDSQNNKVGIGTNTPTANLDVVGTTHISGSVWIDGTLYANNVVSADLEEQTMLYSLIFG